MDNWAVRSKIILLILVLALPGCAIIPEPLTVDELSEYVDDKRSRVTSDQEPVRRAVSLYDAMARALKYNLDHHVELMEVALKERQLRVAHYSMLPELATNAGYTDRNNFTGGNSVSLLSDTSTGAQSLRSSTSSERDVRSSDLSFSWHVLDFGLSYIRAKQAADETLIAEEQRRKVINRIVEDVRTAYWKAVTATPTGSKLVRTRPPGQPSLDRNPGTFTRWSILTIDRPHL